jgi:hypothetical protein
VLPLKFVLLFPAPLTTVCLGAAPQNLRMGGWVEGGAGDASRLVTLSTRCPPLQVVLGVSVPQKCCQGLRRKRVAVVGMLEIEQGRTSARALWPPIHEA